MKHVSGHLERLPNLYYDICARIPVMGSNLRRAAHSRSFLMEFQDRILFGTDIGMSTTLPQHVTRVSLIRRFLETGEEFHTPESADDLLTRYPEPYNGLDLPRGTLEKIYAGNFWRLWGSKPRGVDLETAISTCEKEGNAVMGEALKGLNQ